MEEVTHKDATGEDTHESKKASEDHHDEGHVDKEEDDDKEEEEDHRPRKHGRRNRPASWRDVLDDDEEEEEEGEDEEEDDPKKGKKPTNNSNNKKKKWTIAARGGRKGSKAHGPMEDDEDDEGGRHAHHHASRGKPWHRQASPSPSPSPPSAGHPYFNYPHRNPSHRNNNNKTNPHPYHPYQQQQQQQRYYGGQGEGGGGGGDGNGGGKGGKKKGGRQRSGSFGGRKGSRAAGRFTADLRNLLPFDLDEETDEDEPAENAGGEAAEAEGAGEALAQRWVGLPDGQRVAVVEEEEGADAAAAEASGPDSQVFEYGQQCSIEEDAEHEFKAVQNSGRPIDRIGVYCEHYVNAFLNSDGGTIYFGISDDGKVLGVPLNRKQRDQLRLRIDAIVSAFKPQVDPYLLKVNFLKVQVSAACPTNNASTPAGVEPSTSECKARGLRFVVEVVVERGRAPVYFTSHGSAYIRRAGSVYKMDNTMVEERKRMGRPLLPARRAREEPKRPPVLAHTSSRLSSSSGGEPTTAPDITVTSPSVPDTPAAPLDKPPATTPATEAPSASSETVISSAPAVSPSEPVSTPVTQPETALPESTSATTSAEPAEPVKTATATPASIASTADVATVPVNIASSEPSLGNVAPNEFVGREKELQQINDFVDFHHPKSGKIRTTNIVILLYGLPVVGKSALARRLMAEFADRYPDFHFQINMKGVTSGYISLADAMIGVIRSVHPTMALPDNMPAIKGIYESCFKGLQCMLLIENVGSVDHIAPLLPITSKSCFVVATSRKDLSLDITLGTDSTLSIKLGTMKSADAIKLVLTLLPRASPEEARELARLCGNLPLPIRLIGSVIRRKPNLTLSSMIKKLQNNDVQLMAMIESSLGVADEEYPPEVYGAMRSLCLFPATFDGCAAAALLDKTYEETEDILGVLLEYSLLDFELVTGRYHMNDLVRSHALHKALEADPRMVDVLRERFVRHFLKQLQSCCLPLEQPRQAEEAEHHPTEQAKETATLLFTRERYNFEACVKFLAQKPRPSSLDALAAEFTASYEAAQHLFDPSSTKDHDNETQQGETRA